jgi:CheY-like chemotaxis protein
LFFAYHPRRHDLRNNRIAARILIADDHQLLADACKSILEPEFSVVGTVNDGCHQANAVKALTPYGLEVLEPSPSTNVLYDYLSSE